MENDAEYPDEYSVPDCLGLKRTVRKFANGWVDEIHDYVGEEQLDI